MDKLNPNHPMTELFAENAVKLLGLLIWKFRAQCPNLEATITAADVEQFTRVFAGGKEPAVICIGEGKQIRLRLADEDGQALVMKDPGTTRDDPRVKEMEEMMRVRKEAPTLARLLDDWLSGSYTSVIPPEEAIRNAANALRILSNPD